MTFTGYRLCDIGDDFTWIDLRDFITHLPTVEAALNAPDLTSKR